MRHSHFLLLGALLGLSQCQHTAPVPTVLQQLDLLPPLTQTGRRTFGCLVDGKAWNLSGDPARPAFSAQYSNTNQLTLYTVGTSSTSGVPVEETLQLRINKLLTVAQYNQSGDTCAVTYKRFTPACTYVTCSKQVAKVVLTHFDSAARIVSGTFAFELESPGCGQVTVSAGRFDARF